MWIGEPSVSACTFKVQLRNKAAVNFCCSDQKTHIDLINYGRSIILDNYR